MKQPGPLRFTSFSEGLGAGCFKKRNNLTHSGSSAQEMFLPPRISQRVEASRAQLQAIGERVTLAQAKIEKIKGSKKAIKVVTSVKAAWPLFFLLSLLLMSALEKKRCSAAAAAAHSPLYALMLSRIVVRIPFLTWPIDEF